MKDQSYIKQVSTQQEWLSAVTYREGQAMIGLGDKNRNILGEIFSDLYRSVQYDIKKCDFDSLKLEQNPWNCD